MRQDMKEPSCIGYYARLMELSITGHIIGAVDWRECLERAEREKCNYIVWACQDKLRKIT